MKIVQITSTMNIDSVKRKRHCPKPEIPRHQKVVGICLKFYLTFLIGNVIFQTIYILLIIGCHTLMWKEYLLLMLSCYLANDISKF